MFQLLIVSFYLILPAYFANMAPVIFNRLGWLKLWAKPIDKGIKYHGNFVFGKSKTWRGIVSAVMTGVMIAGLQAWLQNYAFFYNISLVDYSNLFLLFGVLAGFGAIMGDLIKSFIKRRLGIKSGRPWPVFDQWDFVAGFFIFTYWLIYPDWQIILTVFLITLVLHPLVNVIGYILGIKKVWW
jgi:CDP-2,3-bis-(O-geranylgeranyl)-sn-glycerol synthase